MVGLLASKWLLRITAGLIVTAGLLAGFVLLAGTRTASPPSDAPGYSTAPIVANHRPEGLLLHLWYPASAGQITLIGQNALFYGFHARRDAPADAGLHPIVLLSHGSGGNAERLGWIGAALARQGMIVAAVNHPGTTSGDSQPLRTVMPWERTADLAAILDHLARSKPQGITPDMARVGALGFSLGGGTVLLSAGARLSKPAFIAYCAAHAGADDCDWLAQGGVDFTLIDAQRYEQSNHDPRIRAVVAVDPALSQAMTPASLADVPPALVINLGSVGDVPVAMRADAAAAQMTTAEYAAIPGAAHFSFLARCSLFGAVVIALAGDDNICTDTGLRARETVQAELADVIAAFFLRRL